MLFLMFVLAIAAALGVVYLVSLLWAIFFVGIMPSFVSGLVGGLAALPVWESLKRLRAENPPQQKRIDK